MALCGIFVIREIVISNSNVTWDRRRKALAVVCLKALVAVQGISRNVFRHAVSETEMVEAVLDHERAFEVSR